jgi:hypothetical protein
MTTKSMTIDLGGDIHEWRSVSEMAPLIGVSTSAIYFALEQGRPCNGFILESREVDDELRDELGLHHMTRSVIRVSREEPRMEQRSALRRAEARMEAESPGKPEKPAATMPEEPEPKPAETKESEPESSASLELDRLRSETTALSATVERMANTLAGVSRELPERLHEFEVVEAVRSVALELELARNRLPSELTDTPLPEAVQALRSKSDVDLEDVVWRFLADEILPGKAKSEFARVLRARRSA